MWVWRPSSGCGPSDAGSPPGPTGDPCNSAVMSAAEVEAPAAVPSSPVLTEQLTVGTQVVLRTTFGEQISSTVFAHDLQSSCLLLREPGAHNGVATLRLLRSAFIEEVVSTKQPEQPNLLDYAEELPELCGDKCKRREERALAAAELDASRVGEGVTKEAQMLFDALSKTMPCRWEGKAIVVLDEVIVHEPYTADAAMADKQHQTTLHRVQKVINLMRQRLGV